MKILLATDGLEPANRARRLVEKLANRAAVEVGVLSVQWAPVHFDEDLWGRLDPPVPSAEDIAKRDAERLEAAGFNASWETAEGSPGTELIRAVERWNFDLTVTGAGRESWLGNLLLGSVSTHVLHASPSSVLIVHRLDPGADGHVLVGVDGSPGARRAVDDVAGFADPARVRVTVASVIYERVVVQPPANLYFRKQLLEEAHENVCAAGEMLEAAGFKVDTITPTGHPSTTLLQTATDIGADLIAVGSRGLGAVGRVVLGSVSDPISRHAPAALVSRRIDGDALSVGRI